MKTPVDVPDIDAGVRPACSTASQQVSSSTRCCGSMAMASRSLIPKKSGSKPVTSSRKAPHFDTERPGTPDSRSKSSSASQRSPGTSVTMSSPRSSASHSLWVESIPPGSRQAMPTTAIGVAEESRTSVTPRSSSVPVLRRYRPRCFTSGLPWVFRCGARRCVRYQLKVASA